MQLVCGTTAYDLGRPYLMGVLNVTPDSFSDGGKFYEPSEAVEQGLRMAEEGADFIDVGGESTRPGSDPVQIREELRRVLPIVAELSSRLANPISVDTYKSEVAREAVAAGAQIINDITGLRGDPAMAGVVAELGTPVVLMHIKGTPKTMQQNPHYDVLIGEIKAYLAESAEIALGAGVDRRKIVLDPGIGFGKTFPDNFRIIKHLREFTTLGYPILVGASRKSFLSNDRTYEVDERLEQSLAAAAIAVLHGANIIRTHDVAATKKAVWVAQQMLSG